MARLYQTTHSFAVPPRDYVEKHGQHYRDLVIVLIEHRLSLFQISIEP